MEYVYATYILERAENEGALVVNKPSTLRDANEKVFTAWFSQCAPPTLVSRDFGDFRDFIAEHGEIILKPLDGMGGASIFRLSPTDPNLNVTLEILTNHQTRFAMAQRFIPEIGPRHQHTHPCIRLARQPGVIAAGVSRCPCRRASVRV